MELVLIPPGKFMMGDEKYKESQVEVTLTKPLYVGKTEVTQAQYESLMGKNPSWFSKAGGGKDEVKAFNTSDCPVENVSWGDAQRFCQKLSQKEGQMYLLLTEAEWEYACRAGTTTKFSTGASLSSSDANFDDTELNRTTSVGRYAPNAFGLHDMHGNVWEWCEDVYATKLPGGIDPLATTGSSLRVFRGGGWGSEASSCRSAFRIGHSPDFRDSLLGFRVARVPVSEPD
jgi:formylglycine-generating enzyme required for sulfatase activity